MTHQFGDAESFLVPQVIPQTVGESLYWSYANMAMAFASARHMEPTYQQIDFIVRNKTYYGLLRGTLNLGSLFKDEREKIYGAAICSYCGNTENLSLDHLIPKLLGGGDAADNLVTACRSCNSSKGGRDLLEWFAIREEFPTLVLLRRYLKLAIRYCVNNDLMNMPLERIQPSDTLLPFAIHLMPHVYPDPSALIARFDPSSVAE